jgi:CIC family chloride channel protein
MIDRNGTPSVRSVYLTALAILLGLAAAGLAVALTRLIAIATNVSFYGRWSTQWVSPEGHALGPWIIGVPVIGGVLVGILARFGSPAIRGHGIPEAMENVLLRQSKIPARITWLKPLSAAIAIGTGGPFGAEGPIIATGGSFGSLVGQLLPVSAAERKVLLAAGAAAGMAATFGSPLAAVLLAVELLLFEFRPRSIIPVSIAASVATIARFAIGHSTAPAFRAPPLDAMTPDALIACLVLGALMGVIAVLITKLVYGVEDLFEKLPIHWMWWPALGGLAVGIVGYFFPGAMHVGYDKIDGLLEGSFAPQFLTALLFWKLVAWSISLGSGTSGGTLAPLFMIGGTIGSLVGHAARDLFPGFGVTPELLALVGMASLFAGASRAMLASAVFAFEVTRRPEAILGLVVGCAAAQLVANLLMKHSIMTEKIARRGVRVGQDYEVDPLDGMTVAEVMTKDVVTIPADLPIQELRSWCAHGGIRSDHPVYPVIDVDGRLVGIFRRKRLVTTDPTAVAAVKVARELCEPPPAVLYPDESLREAAETMVRHELGRLPVVNRAAQGELVGFLTRRDVMAGRKRRIEEETHRARVFAWGGGAAEAEAAAGAGHGGSAHN